MVFCIMPLLGWKHEITLLQSSFRERKWKKKCVWVCVSMSVGDGSWISLWIAEQKQVLQFHQWVWATGGDEQWADRGSLIWFGIDSAEVALEPLEDLRDESAGVALQQPREKTQHCWAPRASHRYLKHTAGSRLKGPWPRNSVAPRAPTPRSPAPAAAVILRAKISRVEKQSACRPMERRSSPAPGSAV